MEKLLIVFGILVFGILVYAVYQVWTKIKTDGFDHKKFFGENKRFWIVCVIFSLLMSIGIVYIKGFEDVLHNLGFAVDIEDGEHAGYVLLGIALAIGSDKTKITGTKKLISPK